MATKLLIDPPAKRKLEAWELGLYDGRTGRSPKNPYLVHQAGLAEGARILLSSIYEQAYSQGRSQRGETNG
jgi:hypothetical protein